MNGLFTTPRAVVCGVSNDYVLGSVLFTLLSSKISPIRRAIDQSLTFKAITTRMSVRTLRGW